ncbi:RraA family protein [Gracilibacillus alcaliphilus]|uniref:RraA family protein n=1 Tax=Gracilibacillus alcaliphilus TaxID=1401441 RepID=UPI00195DD83B|nr:RraA family protein [Gracilibacillus alcaliphilus]MBM7677291.1 regulator of RNase E activity RraA [Gracilibacillus alcaliphilus]
MKDIGFRILQRERKISRQMIDQFRNVVTPHVSDNMNRMFSAGSELRPYFKQGKLIGVALTIRTRPGDNLMVHKAIDLAEPGDVLVVDAGGETTNAIMGEIMLELSKKKGIRGCIVNGAIRDSSAFLSGDFPMYAKGVTHRGPYKDGPGEINVPVSIGGMIIEPGDLIIGDEDGVVAIPAHEAEQVLIKVKEQEKKEYQTFEEIKNGTIDRRWIDETLKTKGCEIDEISK